MTYETFKADGYVFDCSPITFDAGSGVTTVVGSSPTVKAVMRDKPYSTVTGSTSISSATKIVCTFDPDALAVGNWKVQVRITPSGADPRTILEFDLVVKRSA